MREKDLSVNQEGHLNERIPNERGLQKNLNIWGIV
jgi:hypothetical protein